MLRRAGAVMSSYVIPRVVRTNPSVFSAHSHVLCRHRPQESVGLDWFASYILTWLRLETVDVLKIMFKFVMCRTNFTA